MGSAPLVRPERLADRHAVEAVVRDAFFRQAAEVVRLVERLRASDEGGAELALVAEDDSGVIGHVMLGWVRLDGGPPRRLLNLTPLSVRRDRQRRGVGSALVRAALHLADRRGEPLVLVEGVPAYYPRFGFEPASGLGLAPPHAAIPDDAFLARRLSAYDPAIRGRVVYPSAFDHLAPPSGPP